MRPTIEPFRNEDEERLRRLGNISLPRLENEDLMDIFDFDELALDMNRRHFVTQTQREMIGKELKNEADAMWLLLLIGMAVSVLLAIIFAMQGYPTLYLVIGLAAFLLPMLAYAYLHQVGLSKDNERLRVMRIDGVPHPFIRGRGNDMRLSIEHLSFPVTLEQARLLGDFRLPMVRVYYAEHSKQILSMEILHEEKLKNYEDEDFVDARDYGDEKLKNDERDDNEL